MAAEAGTEQYDIDGLQYEEAKKSTDCARYVEIPTFLHEVGATRDKSVLDLGCGTGFYTRMLRAAGASRVVGADMSEEMVRVARRQEAANPQGIEYRVEDATKVPTIHAFDIVTAAYLFPHAANMAELTAMAQGVARNLTTGGRLVAIIMNPDFDYDGPNATKYGYTVRKAGSFDNGSKYHLTIGTPPLVYAEAFNYSRNVYEQALTTAGLTDLQWIPPRISPAGMRAHGASYWADLLQNPGLIFLTARRP